ncbi:hypothetical protein V495_05982 [Pseudogymnoascus sp. VKM F-4514 (FW-929)]|nr:hypothetical protein V495_05982 [Pseudogymnoascus sp. VKM F-4514 (FW-929)]KFY65921.1 hypothetical protein V497_01240 [Pseudogymnoascus sp. VKM F-4516 (FW-969)]
MTRRFLIVRNRRAGRPIADIYNPGEEGQTSSSVGPRNDDHGSSREYPRFLVPISGKTEIRRSLMCSKQHTGFNCRSPAGAANKCAYI